MSCKTEALHWSGTKTKSLGCNILQMKFAQDSSTRSLQNLDYKTTQLWPILRSSPSIETEKVDLDTYQLVRYNVSRVRTWYLISAMRMWFWEGPALNSIHTVTVCGCCVFFSEFFVFPLSMDLWPSFPIYSPILLLNMCLKPRKIHSVHNFPFPYAPLFILPILVPSILFVFVSKCAFWQLNRFSFFRKGRNQKRVLEMKVFCYRSFETGGWEDLSSGREQICSQRLHSIPLL